jgi:hypothetical protein
LLNPEDLFAKKYQSPGRLSSDDNSDFDYDDISTEVQNYKDMKEHNDIDKNII